MSPRKIAIAGNPNTGKTTVFNRLTGLRQRTGNFPGVTVEKKVGELIIGEETCTIIDLPGTYSLDGSSLDERVTIDILTGILPNERIPDLVVVVIDAANAKRNLFLASQIAEFDIPMVLAFNQWDVAQSQDIRIDLEAVREELGVEVVPMNAKKSLGIDELKDAIRRTLDQPKYLRKIEWPVCVDTAAQKVASAVNASTNNGLPDYLSHRMLFDNSSNISTRLRFDRNSISEVFSEARKTVEQGGYNPSNVEAVVRYKQLGDWIDAHFASAEEAKPHTSDSIDKLLCHWLWGLLIFCGMMWFVFQAVYAWAGPVMDLIDAAFGGLGELISPMLASTPMLESLVVDGIIAGVGGVVVFLPQIFILFFFIGLLEETGYLSRAAFLVDKLFSWCGLNGKCFIPLLSSYACAVPGILSARTIEDPKARMATVFIAPYMSCSARLPVYVLFIGAFIEPIYGPFIAGLVLFLMHFVGLFVAAPIAAVLNRFILKTPPQPFLLVMPNYREPKFTDLVLRMWLQGKEFLINAGTVIFAFSIIIWALLYFPHPEELADEARDTFIQEQAAALDITPQEIESRIEAPDSELAGALEAYVDGRYLEHSYLARFGNTVQPVFGAAGFDWKITIGVLASFPARELIVSTLGIIYKLGGEVDEESTALRDTMAASVWQDGPREGQPVFTIPVALAVMVFFALCLQCGATVATMGREIGWKWAASAFAFATALAWVAAVATYQLGNAILT